jgi:hypothetical protein
MCDGHGVHWRAGNTGEKCHSLCETVKAGLKKEAALQQQRLGMNREQGEGEMQTAHVCQNKNFHRAKKVGEWMEKRKKLGVVVHACNPYAT